MTNRIFDPAKFDEGVNFGECDMKLSKIIRKIFQKKLLTN